MADPVAMPSVSALAGVATAGQRLGHRDGPAGVTIAEVVGLGMASVAVRRGQAEALGERIRSILGVDLPSQGKVSATGSLRVLWSGPGQWIVQFGGGRRGVPRLARALTGLAAVTDQSDSRAVLHLHGARVRESLAKGLMIDLHPGAFDVDDTALTLAGHIGVQITMLDARPAYQVMVSRSYSLSCWDWLIMAAAAYGVAVESEATPANEGNSFDLE